MATLHPYLDRHASRSSTSAFALAALFPVVALCALSACGHVTAPSRAAVLTAGRQSDAFRALSSPRGPERFAQMTPMLYRGAQATASQLALLCDLGIKTIVSFADDPAVVRAEVAAAGPLGLEVHNYPFSGLQAPDPALLHRIVDSIGALPGPIYIHCRLGRDRTSLIAALYRVWVQGWDPATAWRREARDFGHRGVYSWFFRKLDRTYREATRAPAPQAS